MARNFVAASSQQLVATSSPITAVPLTLACWFKPVSATVAYCMFGIDTASAAERFCLFGSTTGNVRAVSTHLGANFINVTPNAYSAGAWSHGAVTFGPVNQFAYLNGTPSTVGSPKFPTGFNRVRISGAFGASFFDGSLAECGLWNVELTQAEISTLALGVSPLLVRPGALVGYWPLRHGYSPEIDLVSTNTAALANAPTISPHPRVLLPKPRLVIDNPAAAPPAVVPGTRHQRQAHGATTRCRAQRRAGARCRRRR